MAKYGELSVEQRNRIQLTLIAARRCARAHAQVLTDMRAVVAYYVGNSENDFALLDVDAVIPNESGLAGATDLTKGEAVNGIGYQITASATPDGSVGSYNTDYHRLIAAKFCGPENLINR